MEFFFKAFKLLFSCRPDKRVIRLIERMGSNENSKQKRVLCMNKVDLVEVKKDLLKVAKEFGDLPGYDRFVMFFTLLLITKKLPGVLGALLIIFLV